MVQKVKIFNFDFDSFHSPECAAEAIFKIREIDKLPVVITPNVEQIVSLESFVDMKRFLTKSYLILPDGMPIVWFSRLLPTKLECRITGSDVFPYFWKKAQKLNKKVLFIAASDDIGQMLSEEYHRATFYVPPFFELGNDSYKRTLSIISQKIYDEKPDFVVIGISYPKREVLCKDLVDKNGTLNETIYLLLGAAPEFYLKLKKRAPIWMQNYGVEWLYRLFLEPKRLLARYMISGMKFIPLMLREIMGKKK